MFSSLLSKKALALTFGISVVLLGGWIAVSYAFITLYTTPLNAFHNIHYNATHNTSHSFPTLHISVTPTEAPTLPTEPTLPTKPKPTLPTEPTVQAELTPPPTPTPTQPIIPSLPPLTPMLKVLPSNSSHTVVLSFIGFHEKYTQNCQDVLRASILFVLPSYETLELVTLLPNDEREIFLTQSSFERVTNLSGNIEGRECISRIEYNSSTLPPAEKLYFVVFISNVDEKSPQFSNVVSVRGATRVQPALTAEVTPTSGSYLQYGKKFTLVISLQGIPSPTNGGADLSVRLVGPAMLHPVDRYIDYGNGTYSINFIVFDVGVYAVEVRIPWTSGIRCHKSQPGWQPASASDPRIPLIANAPHYIIIADTSYEEPQTPLCTKGDGPGRWLRLPSDQPCRPPICTGDRSWANYHDEFSMNWVWTPYDCHYHFFTREELLTCAGLCNLHISFEGESRVRELFQTMVLLVDSSASLPKIHYGGNRTIQLEKMRLRFLSEPLRCDANAVAQDFTVQVGNEMPLLRMWNDGATPLVYARQLAQRCAEYGNEVAHLNRTVVWFNPPDMQYEDVRIRFGTPQRPDLGCITRANVADNYYATSPFFYDQTKPTKTVVLDAYHTTTTRFESSWDGMHYSLESAAGYPWIGGVARMHTFMLMNMLCNRKCNEARA